MSVSYNQLENFTVTKVLAESVSPSKRLLFFVQATGENPGYRVESWDADVPVPSVRVYTSLYAAVAAYNAI